MPPSDRTKSAQPANFLTLPREIRQKVLYELFNDVCEQDAHFTNNVLLLEQALGIRSPKGQLLPHTHDHASTLYSIHQTVSEDVRFVANQVLASFGDARRQVMSAEDLVKKRYIWCALATEIHAWGYYADEDFEALHHRRFTMVQGIWEAIGADTSQFSFCLETAPDLD